MSGFKSEILKYKRTFIKKLIVFIPVFCSICFSGASNNDE